MKTISLISSLGLALALSTSFAADKQKPAAADKEKPVATDKASPVATDKASPVATDKAKSASTPSPDALFIKRAADAGMTEMEAGKVAEKNGQRDDVKAFGSRMIKDFGKANENLKSVATKMNTAVPEKIRPRRQWKIDQMAKLPGAAFDTAYITAMIQDHQNTIAGFEKALASASNEDLKKFINDTLPVLKEHLETAKKMQSAK